MQFRFHFIEDKVYSLDKGLTVVHVDIVSVQPPQALPLSIVICILCTCDMCKQWQLLHLMFGLSLKETCIHSRAQMETREQTKLFFFHPLHCTPKTHRHKYIYVNVKSEIGDLLVMCGHAFLRITCVLGVFDHQAVVLGYLETAHSSHQFSAAK